MLKEMTGLFPPEGFKILLTLFLSFLIGLEREERKGNAGHYVFGGVRTFPLIGLLGFALALLSGDQLVPLAIGFAVVGAFLLVSYLHKLSAAQEAGVTTEMSGLVTYVVGVLVQHDQFWIATTLVVLSMILLELKVGLEGLARRLPGEEIATFTKFLLISAVILPVVPNQSFTVFELNPYKTWLVVVAVSTVSYGSYALLRVLKAKGGVLIAALLGGVYSSTVTTVALSKRAVGENRPHLYAGAILMASGVMYVRLVVLVWMFNRPLAGALAPPFLMLAAVASAAGWLWSRMPDPEAEQDAREYAPHNPLELRSAFLFAFIFIAMLVATHLAVTYLGREGVYGLAAVMGVTDVDPFILGLTQTAGTATPLAVAAAGIVIAAASNNLVKGLYALSFADRGTGRQSLALLACLALMGLVPLLLL